MSDPTTVTDTTSGTASGADPCKLSPPGPDEGLADWKSLLNHRPPADVRSDLKTRFGADAPTSHVYHHITEGTGDCNFDFYALQIVTMPNKKVRSDSFPYLSSEVPYDRQGLLTHIRTSLNSFMNQGIAKFGPYSPSDETTWKGSSPLKSVMRFDMKAFPNKAEGDLPADKKPDKPLVSATVAAGVVCSEITDEHWIFTTTWTKDTGYHPVYGYRQFGIGVLKSSQVLPSRYCGVNFTNRDKDVLYFYTRGVDRKSDAAFFALTPGEVIFSGGHECWKAFMQNVHLWITQNGGSSTLAGYTSKREDWNRVKKGTTWDKGSP